MLTASRERARVALACVHGFDIPRKGKRGALAVLERHMCIQSDPIDIAGRNHDLTLQSRVSDYRKEYLDELLYKDRKLFEYYCKMASIMPMDTYPVFQYLRDHYAEQFQSFFKEHPSETREILRALDDAPVCSNDFKSEKKVDYWGKTQVYRVILERLFISGRTALHHRAGGIKYYTLAEKAIPGKLLEAGMFDREGYHRAVTLMIVKASRLVSPSKATEQWHAVGKAKEIAKILDSLEREGELFTLEVEGWKGKLFAPAEDAGIWQNPSELDGHSVRFLAPLDPLLWNRKLFGEIYGHEYVWEVYKQAHERRYGYYCLPVLYNGDYIGLIEPYFRKKDRALELRSFHALRKGLAGKDFNDALEAELSRFATNLGAEGMEAGERCPGFLKKIAGRYSSE